MPIAELDQDGDNLRIPAPDASYDAVFCLRTLAHLGRDEDSSLALVRSLLQEAVRVTAPGGVLLLEINNPRSLRGLAYGIRNPITIVADGSVVVAREHHVTRYDSLGRLLKLAPRELELVRVYGIRVLVPISRILSLPVVGRVLAAGEWWARDSFLRQFGAHLLAVLRKPDPNAGRIAHP
jgi:SAM-dependent methyltransferase